MGDSSELYLWPGQPIDPHAPALDDLERVRSRGELVERVNRIAHLMRDQLGLSPGDHAAMLMGNRVEFVELLLGSVLAGVRLTPINWHLTAGEASYIVDDCGAKALFADPAFAATAREATTGPLIVAGDELDAALAAQVTDPFPLDGPAGASMLYTSGTTGRPKGVRHARWGESVEQAVARSVAVANALGLGHGGTHLVTGPLYHSAPLGYSIPSLHTGAALVIQPRWDPEAMLRLIEERQVRTMHMVPIMMVRALRLPPEVKDAFDPSSLVTVLHGAAPVSPAVKAQMIEWWGEVLVEYWGSTEGGVFTLVGSHDWLTKPGTVGKAIATYEVFAVDAHGGRLPPGEVGTLYTRNLATTEVFEYHGDKGKTDAAHLEPGVFTMGDVGWIDEDGYVFLSDRAADMIISGGVNIYPMEIEQVLISHPAVRDIAVFGIPDEEWGESVKAAMEVADGYTAGPDLERDILTWAREHMAGFKVPRSIDFVEQLPRHPTGKLYKRLLRDRYWNREGKFI